MEKHEILYCYYKQRGFPGSSVVNNPPANAGAIGLIPGLGKSPGGGSGDLLQYSCLENPMDRGAWWAIHPLNYRSSAEVVVVVGGLVTKSCLTLATHGL